MNSLSQTSKYADCHAVKRAADTLMLLNGETTTLEVKKFLRLEGYIAFQQEISDMMDYIAKTYGNWVYTCNGKFRTYTFEIMMDFQVSPQVPAFSWS